ncbi:MAG: hypothetical protein AAF633_12320, partial [Chloroflexota bacterium]
RGSPNDIDRLEGGESSKREHDEATRQIHIFAHLLDLIHRRRLDGLGRVWLLLRYFDHPGEGRLPLSEIRFRLTRPESETKCLSSKRLQQLIRQGEGLFWHKSRDRRWLYLHSEPRVARDLGVQQIGGHAVEITPVSLLQSVKRVRALFYDAFHSGRGEGCVDPITRRSLHDRGGAEAQTQRKYERLRGIDPKANYALLGRYNRHMWQRATHEPEAERIGGPAFIFIDYKGVLGKNPARIKRKKQFRHWHHIYVARRIGNSYQGTLPTVKRGRRWTNWKLKHLCQSMRTGRFCVSRDRSRPTGSFAADRLDRPGSRFYFVSEDEVHKAVERSDEEASPLYHWHDGRDKAVENTAPPEEKYGQTQYWDEWFNQSEEMVYFV